jgi:hypothetical protein
MAISGCIGLIPATMGPLRNLVEIVVEVRLPF